MRKYLPHVVVLALMGLTSAVLLLTTNVEVQNDVGVRLDLPAEVGEWRGRDVFFCQSEACMAGFTSDMLQDTGRCSRCGSALKQNWSLGEVRLLPADTILLKKEYVAMGNMELMVSVLVSGSEEVSIHRPQICLTGQGYEIVGEKTLRFPVSGRSEPLDVSILDLRRRYRRSDGSMEESQSSYVYWFVGSNRETHSHLVRMAWTAFDRVVHGRAGRWSYVAIAYSLPADSPVGRERLETFLRQFYPAIKK